GGGEQRSPEEIFSALRSTARNLVRRAEKDGVTIERSSNPNRDIEHFLKLHDETRKRHGFTPYTNKFFRAEVERFAARGECSLYLAHFQNEVIAASIHIHAFGETSYHHGASTERFRKIPASYLLQWTAIKDALARGDHIYNFWGIAPTTEVESGKLEVENKRHPFSGVTLFKTGFGGALLNVQHCRDVPVSPMYYGTRAFEYIRKWRRGF
ncbi:MAG TPA: peptidoglycan bridge formation glycyltransferase FemA/FemB family protein, partial [Candidatus Peribacteraceae bacterium]|nr:peptidoglycan bridge formation glycyltransferase FemA/FemB family protein [Candidatus Peribacteraceae bacterium]